MAADTGFVQGSWFTYDHAASGAGDHNRWYTFGGNVGTTDASVTLPLYLNVGGNFNALPITSATQVGMVTLGFGDCTSGTMHYAFSDGTGRSGSIALTRLTPNVTCSQAQPVTTDSDFALSGNWFDASKGGQGIVVEVNPVGKLVFFAWYTCSGAGQAAGVSGQRWFTGQAAYTAGVRSINLALYETTGGLFDHSAPVPTTAQVGDGQSYVRRLQCDASHVHVQYRIECGTERHDQSDSGRTGARGLYRLRLCLTRGAIRFVGWNNRGSLYVPEAFGLRAEHFIASCRKPHEKTLRAMRHRISAAPLTVT